MSDSEIGRQLDDAAGLVRIRPKPKPPPESKPKKEFPDRALRFGVGKPPLITNDPIK